MKPGGVKSRAASIIGTASWNAGTLTDVSIATPEIHSPPRIGSTAQHGTSPHVLYVASSRSDGGIERCSVQMAAALARRGVPVTFACLPGGPVEAACRAAGIPTLPFFPRNSGDLRAAHTLATQIKARGIDIVHVHSRRDYLPALLAVRKVRCERPVGFVLHAHMLRSLGQPARLSARLFAAHVDLVLCVSEAVQDFVTRDGALPLEQTCTLYNGVEGAQFAASGTAQADRWRTALRREWNVDREALVLTMVGRLDAKGQVVLVDALPGLAARFPSVRVVLVGDEGSEGEAVRLLERARALGVTPHLLLAGPRSDVPAVLAASDVLVHLPTDEAFGLALAEGMAAGLPVVASWAGGCPEVVRDGVTGLLVPPDDPAALVEALDVLLCGPKGTRTRAQMGEAGRARTAKLFSLSAQTDALLDAYAVLCPVSAS